MKGHSRTVSGSSPQKMSDCAPNRIFLFFKMVAKTFKLPKIILWYKTANKPSSKMYQQ